MSGSRQVDKNLPMEVLPLENSAFFRAGQRLPRSVKHFLLACYWPLKAFFEDWIDYSAELVGKIPSHTIRISWYRHLCGMRIGKCSSIHRSCRMYAPFRIEIGEHSVVNYGVLLDGRRGIRIGNNVSISEGVVILTQGHDIDDPDFVLEGGPVTIQDRAFIGSYSRILPGVTIAEGAVVGVGAVVTRDVGAYTVVVGVPARYARNRARDLNYQLNHRKRFG